MRGSGRLIKSGRVLSPVSSSCINAIVSESIIRSRRHVVPLHVLDKHKIEESNQIPSISNHGQPYACRVYPVLPEPKKRDPDNQADEYTLAERPTKHPSPPLLSSPDFNEALKTPRRVEGERSRRHRAQNQMQLDKPGRVIARRDARIFASTVVGEHSSRGAPYSCPRPFRSADDLPRPLSSLFFFSDFDFGSGLVLVVFSPPARLSIVPGESALATLS